MNQCVQQEVWTPIPNTILNTLIIKFLDLANDEVSVKCFEDLWRSLLKQHIALVCFKEGSDEIIGLNLVGIVLKEEKDEKYLVCLMSINQKKVL